MTAKYFRFLCGCFCFLYGFTCGQSFFESSINKGWSELVKDNDSIALLYFNEAYRIAKAAQDDGGMADASYYMGITTYSVSYSIGLRYAMESMKLYEQLNAKNPEVAVKGRAKCLQLISTIYRRQGKWKESIQLSRQAMLPLPPSKDSSGQLGLIYFSIGSAYSNLQLTDSADYYFQLSLAERSWKKDSVYLPLSLLKVAEIERRKGDRNKSLELSNRALTMAEVTGNRQAVVSSLIDLGQWHEVFATDKKVSESFYRKALQVSSQLSDKSYYMSSLQALANFNLKNNRMMDAYNYQVRMADLKDSLNNWEKQHIQQSLEVQFNLSEKNRQLDLALKEKELNRLYNIILLASLFILVMAAMITIVFLNRINKRNKQLLMVKTELMKVREEQRIQKEAELQNDIDQKESQLSALTLQMVSKNELMQELQESLLKHKDASVDPALNRIIQKGQIQERDWSDFNTYFESINKNFYSRLKSISPDISANDLKLCAMIKMNLSIKEMAGILNISPDSVKTARYRLRKKLQLLTEDNLNDFILNL